MCTDCSRSERQLLLQRYSSVKSAINKDMGTNQFGLNICFLCVCMWRVCCTFKFFMICHIYYLLLLYLFSNVSQVCYDSFLNKFLDNDCKKVTLRKKDRCCLVFFFCRPQRRSQWRVLFLNVISSSPSNNVPREFRGYFCGKWKCARGCAWTVDVSEICVLGLTTSRFSWDFWNRQWYNNNLTGITCRM